MTQDPEALIEWLEEAIEILKPAIQGADITDNYKGVEKEAMRDVMECVRILQLHMEDGLPIMSKVCKCEDEHCPAWQYGYDQSSSDKGN